MSIYINPNLLWSFSYYSKDPYWNKRQKPSLVFPLSYHRKYLLIFHISQLWQVRTFERGSSGISDIRRSFCDPFSSLIAFYEFTEIHTVLQKKFNVSATFPLFRVLSRKLYVKAERRNGNFGKDMTNDWRHPLKVSLYHELLQINDIHELNMNKFWMHFCFCWETEYEWFVFQIINVDAANGVQATIVLTDRNRWIKNMN